MLSLTGADPRVCPVLPQYLSLAFFGHKFTLNMSQVYKTNFFADSIYSPKQKYLLPYPHTHICEQQQI